MSEMTATVTSMWIPVRVVGGPLDGEVFKLDFKRDARIKLHSAAGAGVYDFGTDDRLGAIAHYIGPVNEDHAGPVILEEDLLFLASDGNEAAIVELTKRGYKPNDW